MIRPTLRSIERDTRGLVYFHDEQIDRERQQMRPRSVPEREVCLDLLHADWWGNMFKPVPFDCGDIRENVIAQMRKLIARLDKAATKLEGRRARRPRLAKVG